MIITLYMIIILAIFILCGIIVTKVLQIYLITTKDKALWKKEIKEEKDYEFIKGLY